MDSGSKTFSILYSIQQRFQARRYKECPNGLNGGQEKSISGTEPTEPKEKKKETIHRKSDLFFFQN